MSLITVALTELHSLSLPVCGSAVDHAVFAQRMAADRGHRPAQVVPLIFWDPEHG